MLSFHCTLHFETTSARRVYNLVIPYVIMQESSIIISYQIAFELRASTAVTKTIGDREIRNYSPDRDKNNYIQQQQIQMSVQGSVYTLESVQGAVHTIVLFFLGQFLRSRNFHQLLTVGSSQFLIFLTQSCVSGLP